MTTPWLQFVRPRRGRAPGAAEHAGSRRVRGAAALLLVAIAASLCDAGAAPPGAPQGAARRVLIDRQLNESAVQVVRIDESGVWVRLDREPSSTPPRLRAASDLIAVVNADPQRPARQADSDDRPLVTVALTDGQRIVGRVARDPEGAVPGSASSKDAPLSVDSAFGLVRVPLDAVLSVTVGRGAADSTEVGKDTVVLSNGDVLEGFVESIGSLVAVQPDGSPATTVTLDHVRAVRLANPAVPARGTRAWLADGSLVSVSGLTQAVDALPAARIALLGRDDPTPLPGLDALVFDAACLASLARILPGSFVPAPDRRWTRGPRAVTGPAPLDAPDLELPGPMTVEWELPDRAVRLAGAAELARFTEGWGDCTLTFELGTGGSFTGVWSQRLESAGPRAAFNVSLGSPSKGRRLRLALRSGADGPIQDRVILRRPLLLLADERE